MRVIWHGTAAIEIAHASDRILFDPFVPLQGSEVDTRLEEFDGFTDIFVTHGHLDHIVSLPDIVKRNPDVMIYCTETPVKTLARKGVPARNLTEIGYGQRFQLGSISIHALHGKHAVLPKASLARIDYILRSPNRDHIPYLFHENRECPENDETVFYQIEAGGRTISLMGSMNLRDEIDYPQRADLLILPYNGWEDNFPPAVRVIERLRPKRVLLDHYDDTFPPLTMPLDLTPILDQYPALVAPMEHRKVIEV